jgi:lysophospholipase L1-like esterase
VQTLSNPLLKLIFSGCQRFLTAWRRAAVATWGVLMLTGVLQGAPQFAPVDAELVRPRDGLGNVLTRLKDGQQVKVGYFGGSITEAAGWRVQTLDWLRKSYPKAQVEEINAAIGGTGSDLGVFRLEWDALRHKPDLLFVEFAVNDGGAAPEQIWRAMEGIVRQTWSSNSRTDICFVYTFRTGYEQDLAAGKCPRAASAMEMLAEHYRIPSINVALKTVELQKSGKLIYQSDTPTEAGVIRFSQDGVHPLTEGHQVYTDVITTAMQQMAALPAVDHRSKLSSVFVQDHWQAARMVPVTASMLTGEWRQLSPDSEIARHFVRRMGTLWESSKPGSRLSFEVRGSIVRVYDLLGPDGGQVTISVDGQVRPKPIPRFDSYCTYHRIATLNVAEGLDPKEVHSIIIELHPDQPDRTPVASRLKDPDSELKGAKYQGTNLRVSHILILGELVE